MVQGDASILAKLLCERVSRVLEKSVAREIAVEGNRLLFRSGFLYPTRGFFIFLGFQGEVAISCQGQQVNVKYEISPLLQYKIFSLLFVLGCIAFVIALTNQIDVQRFDTLPLALVCIVGGLIVTACFFIADMVLFPYRFDRFMQSYVQEFFTVFH
jgi:hypothetical protein